MTILLDILLNLDTHFAAVVSQFGAWVYALLALVIFCETGLVVTPFLPGDSLLFVAGAFAALGSLNVWWLLAVLVVAAVVGDTVNYWIGRRFGSKIVWDDKRFLFKKSHLDRTHRFYERHGGKTILLARFVPIIRTIAPFVAGMGSMHYGRFIAYNVIGGLIWVILFVLGGYFFGNIPIVQKNFTAVIFIIIFLSICPGLIAWLRERLRKGDDRPQVS